MVDIGLDGMSYRYVSTSPLYLHFVSLLSTSTTAVDNSMPCISVYTSTLGTDMNPNTHLQRGRATPSFISTTTSLGSASLAAKGSDVEMMPELPFDVFSEVMQLMVPLSKAH